MAQKPIAFVLMSTNHGTMIVNKNDYNEYQNGYKYGVGYQLMTTSECDMNEEQYITGMLTELRKVRGDGVVMLDCGANIGIHTVGYAKHMTGWGFVHGFEPQESIFYALAGNIVLNNCFNARVFHLVLSDETGIMKMPVIDYTKPSSYGSLELRQRENNEYIGQPVLYNEKTINILKCSIDDLQYERVDFIKIDVEGMEMEVLRGAVGTIKKNKPYLFVEKLKTPVHELKHFLNDYEYILADTYGANLVALPKELSKMDEAGTTKCTQVYT